MGFLYVIRSQGFCKIGIAKDVRARYLNLQTGSPVPLEVVAHYEIENAFEIEQILHARLGKKRQMGEWFELDETDLKHIEELVIARGGRKGKPLLLGINGRWAHPPIEATSNEPTIFPEQITDKTKSRKRDQFVKYGSTGRPNLNKLASPQTTLVDGRPAHVWWEDDEKEGPVRCIEFLDE